MLTVSNLNTFGLNEIVEWFPKGEMKFSLGHGDFRGSWKAPLNGDGTATRSLVHFGSMPIMCHRPEGCNGDAQRVPLPSCNV